MTITLRFNFAGSVSLHNSTIAKIKKELDRAGVDYDLESSFEFCKLTCYCPEVDFSFLLPNTYLCSLEVIKR